MHGFALALVLAPPGAGAGGLGVGWGYNEHGQLGKGNITGSAVPVAVDVSGVLNGKTIAQVSAGGVHTCALATDGTAACWGSNWYGQLGGGTSGFSPLPV
ncbi:hypothetical protein, partial [uncultured Thiodictyon sp.]|uniref:hypothetical protein n=1 Tax=uncultured Thiodictyon sp. TaxID=1846217 RepID=UPI0025D7173A